MSSKYQKAGQRSKSYSTDVFMTSLWKHLVRDFRSVEGSHFLVKEEKLLSNMPQFRVMPWPHYFQAPTHTFKRCYQLQNLFKRWIFSQDAFTIEQLEEITDAKFLAYQETLAATPLKVYGTVMRVLQRARLIVKDILGEYDENEHINACRFGKRASVGCPAKRAYPDLRLKGNISGSAEHIKFIEKQVTGREDDTSDHILGQIFAARRATLNVCETLTNTNVPKSWKILRGIMPNTTLGSYYTYGLGKVFQKRLKDRANLDITKLQEIHKALAQEASKERNDASSWGDELVTADLSNASNSYLWDLLNWIMPRKWLNLVKRGRIRRLNVNGKDILLSSFMGMGIGFTFPLQTLVFYSLLKAIAELTDTKGRISVYGDDLIYPRRIHKYVQALFPKMRFNLNLDKTFAVLPFRESCGGDYFKGADVRPFQPEGIGGRVGRMDYLVLVYKAINGLRRRWDDTEISGTLLFLYKEALRITPGLHLVPVDYPDYSGIKTDNLLFLPWWVPLQPLGWDANIQGHSFHFISERQGNRIVRDEISYYWTWHSARSYIDTPVPPWWHSELSFLLRLEDDLRTAALKGVAAENEHVTTPVFNKRLIRETILRRRGNKVRRLRCWRATVTRKDSVRFVSVKASTSLWSLGRPLQAAVE